MFLLHAPVELAKFKVWLAICSCILSSDAGGTNSCSSVGGMFCLVLVCRNLGQNQASVSLHLDQASIKLRSNIDQLSIIFRSTFDQPSIKPRSNFDHLSINLRSHLDQAPTNLLEKAQNQTLNDREAQHIRPPVNVLRQERSSMTMALAQ